MTKIDAAKKFKEEFTPEQQKKIVDIITVTMDACLELWQDQMTNKDITYFCEAVAYKAFAYEIMQHYYDNEYFDFDTKKWVKSITNN